MRGFLYRRLDAAVREQTAAALHPMAVAQFYGDSILKLSVSV
ncbi:MAG TPA: hypothetical protein VGB47_13980 [Thermoanaerobaculia bacterium]